MISVVWGVALYVFAGRYKICGESCSHYLQGRRIRDVTYFKTVVLKLNAMKASDHT